MKITGIVLILSLTACTATAQIERKPVVNPDSAQTTGKADKQSRKERFSELNLTREQKGMLKEIYRSGKSAKNAIENNAQLSESEKKKQLRELQKTQAEKLQAVLTPEQREKFKASRKNNP
jgi:Spy/CpxP family protein refolding chaperone